MIFHLWQNRLNYNEIPKLKFKNAYISLVEEFNFLGMIFDRYLNWKKHLHLLSQKLARTIGMMCRLKNFVPKTCLKMVYNALFNSHLN